MLQKIALWSYRHRWTTIGLWIITLIILGLSLRAVGGQAFLTEIKLKNSDSSAASQLLESKFPDRSGDTGNIAFRAKDGITDPSVKQHMEKVFAEIDAVPHISAVMDPYSQPRSQQVSSDGKIGLALIQFDEPFTNIPRESVERVKHIAEAARSDTIEVELGGQAFQELPQIGSSEIIGLLAALVILLVSFGSVVAAGLPVIIALFGIGVGMLTIQLLTHVFTIPANAAIIAVMIGLGVGIDYALLIVTRYRQELRNKADTERAAIMAINTAGRSVIFAGTTVVISLVGMLLMDIEFIQTMSLSAGLVVVAAMIASATLLPAMLGLIGHRINTLTVFQVENQLPRKTVWYAWSQFLQRHPWPPLLAGFSILFVLTVPLFSMQLGFSDASSRPETDTARRAYDLISDGFGKGVNGPLMVVARLDGKEDLASLAALRTAISKTDDVAQVSPPLPNQDTSAALLQVIPKSSPQDEATKTLIEKLRSEVIPTATKDSGVVAHVGGPTATFDDLAAQLQARLPLFIGAVLVLSALLLMVVFRSILVPLKAVLLNLLSIGAAYGVLVAVFQWGWLESIFGKGPIESFLPMMLFAILFGLSMDYEVFLLSRIKEEYDRTGNNRLAVAHGLSATARIITAAAAIMVIVFLGFAGSDERIIKEFGLGLAVAIFLDATIVRMILVPATMELLGNANWWLPKWLQWLPKLHLESTKKS